MRKVLKGVTCILVLTISIFLFEGCGEETPTANYDTNKIMGEIIEVTPDIEAVMDDGQIKYYINLQKEKNNFTVTNKETKDSLTNYTLSYKHKDGATDVSYLLNLAGKEENGKFIFDTKIQPKLSDVKVKVFRHATADTLKDCIYDYLNEMKPQEIGAVENRFLPRATKENTKVSISEVEYEEVQGQKQLLIKLAYDHKDDKVTAKGSLTLAILHSGEGLPDVMSLKDDFKIESESVNVNLTAETVKKAIAKNQVVSVKSLLAVGKDVLSETEWQSIKVEGIELKERSAMVPGTIKLDGESEERAFVALVTLIPGEDGYMVYVPQEEMLIEQGSLLN